MIHIADAPGHGARLASPTAPALYTRDNYPDHDPDGCGLRRIMLRLREDLKVWTVAATL